MAAGNYSVTLDAAEHGPHHTLTNAVALGLPLKPIQNGEI